MSFIPDGITVLYMLFFRYCILCGRLCCIPCGSTQLLSNLFNQRYNLDDVSQEVSKKL